MICIFFEHLILTCRVILHKEAGVSASLFPEFSELILQQALPQQPQQDLYAVPQGYDEAYAQYQQAMSEEVPSLGIRLGY